jgi:HSP20 family protein
MVMALVRSDPFRDVDRLFQQLWGGLQGNGARPLMMPMDAYRKDDAIMIRLDLPGVQADSVDLTVEGNVLTVRAERPYGTFSRQVFLGNNLDTEHIEAQYEVGVLTVVIPVAEHAKPRRIEITDHPQQQLSA